jgi:hypothetical protein
MEITKDILAQIKEHSADLLPWKDIAYLVGIDPDEFKMELDNKKSKIHFAYRTGIAERKKKLRLPVLKMAEHGSPQAELLADKYLSEQSIAEADD